MKHAWAWQWVNASGASRRVEPLGAVGGRDLVQKHVRHLVEEGFRVDAAVEVAVFLPPVPPASGQPVDNLADGPLRARDLLAFFVEFRRSVVVVLGDFPAAEVPAHHDVGRQLRPLLRHLRVLHLEDDLSVGVGDAASALLPLDGFEDVLPGLRETTRDSH